MYMGNIKVHVEATTKFSRKCASKAGFAIFKKLISQVSELLVLHHAETM